MNHRQDYQCLMFSVSPGSYIHPSWLADMQIDSVFSWDFGGCQKEKLLSEFLIEQSSLENIDFGRFSQRQKNFLVLDSEQTKRLVCYLGIFLCQDLLKSHILKKQVMSIKSNFGENAYLFGLKKAPYLLKAREIVFPDNKKSLDVKGEIIGHGMACLQAYLTFFTDDIKKRVLWKLPNHWQANDYSIASDDAGYLINTIVQEIK